MKRTPQKRSPRLDPRASVELENDSIDNDTRAPVHTQDSAEHLQPASVFAARVLAQLRNLTDATSRNLWRIEYALAERAYWKGAR